ncbi:galactose-1-phosphate uridylyltransferase [Chromatiales bacterium (ex Bugula neritina AB1)]|nr:galactose-1-phosphate uridylyltransferase [Chromatiales bacterium (ex Bugula neritina AB1)]
MSGNWERRWHPLLEQWVVIAANSAQRPWSGVVTSTSQSRRPPHDPECYLCPRVTRASGKTNPDYHGVYAIDNDFPALGAHAPVPVSNDDPLNKRSAATGLCRVLCWSPHHDQTLSDISAAQMCAVAELWQSEVATIEKKPEIRQVLIFENKGVETGASNLHPHGQIYALPFVSDNAQRMRRAQAQYAQTNNGSGLLHSLINHPAHKETLLVDQSEHSSVIVPFAARFSYETWVIPRRHVASITELTEAELHDLALTYQRNAKRYDALFQRPAPNITLVHNSPCDKHPDNRHWHFHIAMQPPLRDREKLKYLAGAEAGMNNIVNPLQPEHAAAQLRDCMQ